MIVDQYGQHVYDEGEVFDILMRLDNEIGQPGPFLIKNPAHNIQRTNAIVGYDAFIKYTESSLSVEEFDEQKQQTWWMPDEYKEMDIAAVVLDLCKTQEELQRCGEELILFQERGLFDLLRYLKYLVDLMELNNAIWGVGRGSSVASYVLYKLKVHRIDSMFYQLDVREFLR